jgi:hypothetical protein
VGKVGGRECALAVPIMFPYVISLCISFSFLPLFFLASIAVLLSAIKMMIRVLGSGLRSRDRSGKYMEQQLPAVDAISLARWKDL